MKIDVVDVTADKLIKSRAELLRKLRLSPDELRRRVATETATVDERIALEGLDEISFLLGEQA